jgi:hypothetical protein
MSGRTFHRAALAATVLTMVLAGASGWQLAQWWAPAGPIGLAGLAVFIAWQTWVTLRLQALVRRVEAERAFAERLTERLLANGYTDTHPGRSAG